MTKKTKVDNRKREAEIPKTKSEIEKKNGKENKKTNNWILMARLRNTSMVLQRNSYSFAILIGLVIINLRK
jgi:hypothetical protein